MLSVVVREGVWMALHRKTNGIRLISRLLEGDGEKYRQT